MKHIDISNEIASSMSQKMEDNKHIFESASMIEKLAFKRVADENVPSELEIEVAAALSKTASCCECGAVKHHGCSCDCHEKSSTSDSNSVEDSSKSSEEPVSKSSGVLVGIFNSLLKASEDLDNAGFEKLAAVSAVLANRLVVEAKAKAKAKKKMKSDKSSTKSKSSPKSKSTKEDKSKSSKETKKDDKSSKSKVSKAQDLKHEVMSKLMAGLPVELRGAVHWTRFDVLHDQSGLTLDGEFRVDPVKMKAVHQQIQSMPKYLGYVAKQVDERVKNTNFVEGL